MGCSASRSHPLLTIPSTEQPPANSLSSSPDSSSNSFSDAYYYRTPISRTISVPTPLIHHPPLRKGDTNHLVSLTSTTYGSLILVVPTPNSAAPSSSPDSVINTWELMEGLDEINFDFVQHPKPNPSIYEKPNSFSNGFIYKVDDTAKLLNSFELVEYSDSMPLWKHLSEESLPAKMDPNVVSSYRRPLASQLGFFKDSTYKKAIPAVCSDNHSVSPKLVSPQFYLSGTEDRTVLYSTSLRGIRKTYKDCCEVRMILVYVDERDTSIDSTFRKELQNEFAKRIYSRKMCWWC